jgi:hypothetical protein
MADVPAHGGLTATPGHRLSCRQEGWETTFPGLAMRITVNLPGDGLRDAHYPFGNKDNTTWRTTMVGTVIRQATLLPDSAGRSTHQCVSPGDDLSR